MDDIPSMAVRTLIAEDERLIALALRLRLESQGYEVTGIASTGLELLDLFAAASPHVILMDVRMPGLDGIEATRTLMQESPACVVIVSGCRDLDQILRAEQAGAMDYIVKPFESHEMRPVLERAQSRFNRFLAIRQQARDPEEALAAWLLVRRAVKALTETEDLSEDDAHARIEQVAAAQCLSLRAAAESLL